MANTWISACFYTISLLLLSREAVAAPNEKMEWSCNITNIWSPYRSNGNSSSESAIIKIDNGKAVYTDQITQSTSKAFGDQKFLHRYYTVQLNDATSLVLTSVADDSVDAIIIDKKHGLFLEHSFGIEKNTAGYSYNSDILTENLPLGVFNDGMTEDFLKTIGYCFPMNN